MPGGRVPLLGIVIALASACSAPPEPEPPLAAETSGAAVVVSGDDPPAAPGALAPDLLVTRDGLLLTWLEPTAEGGHRLVAASRAAGAWSAPVVVVEGVELFVNWADVPVAAEGPDGTLWVAWPQKVSDGTYAYSIFLARSGDGGATWVPAGPLPDDDSPTEHGFPAFAHDGERLVAFWLDGRQMSDGGPMTLRARTLGPDGRGAEELLDDRVCECCPVAATTVGGRPLVAYRNRSIDEIRDPWTVWQRDGAWSEPAPIARESWQIAGCPVNGPSVAATGERVFAAWFTAAGGVPAVRAAVSADGGVIWGEPRLVDGDFPVGRVDLCSASDGSAWLAWLGGGAGEEAELRLAKVARDGARGPVRVVGRTVAGRSSGYPRLVRRAESLALVWREVTAEGARLRFVELPESLASPA